MALIKIKRGLKANIPPLGVGEPGFCTDTKELFVGSPDGNKLVGEGTFLKLSGGTLTGSLILSGNPSLPNQAANKQYVDNVVSGLDVKESVRVIAITPLDATYGEDELIIIMNNNGELIIDGITLLLNDRVLVAGQANYAHNGIYFVKDAGSQTTKASLSRSEDFRSGYVSAGAFAFVEEGNNYAKTGWVLTCDDTPVVIGTSLLIFTQFSGAGAASFLSLNDTPASYVGEKGNVLIVSENGDAIKFADPSTIGRTTFLQLDDTPSAYVNNRLLVCGSSGIDFVAGKVFAGLFSDVPSDISANGKTLITNGGVMNLVDFKTTGLLDMPNALGLGGQMLRVNSGRTALEYFTSLGEPEEGSKTPINGGWAYVHVAQAQGVHGAPEGAKLLHENSTIDGGSW